MLSSSSMLKCLLVGLGVVFLVAIYMSGLLSSEDAEVRAYEQFLLESERKRHHRESERLLSVSKSKIGDNSEVEKPLDWGVHFISGKDMVRIVEGEHKPIQIHEIVIQNMMEKDALVQCRDPLSKFSKTIPPGGSYEFSVTDIFHKRHYWCTVHHDKLIYDFLAYGEGAPRDNNHIILRKEGAFINEKDVTKHSSPKQGLPYTD